MLNSIKVKEWRKKIATACKEANSEEQMSDVKKLSREFTTAMHENESFLNMDLKSDYWVQRCPFVFLDLGSGVGDTVGEFIDAGLEGCRRSDTDFDGFEPMHFDVDTGIFVETPGSRIGEKNEDFTQWVKKRIEIFYSGLGPEDYCVYGVEANPLLKTDLTKLERHVVSSFGILSSLCFNDFTNTISLQNRLYPRPVRHLHFFTEVAIHSEDDVTKSFYIDSVHNNEKYPGSTLFENNKDIREAVDKFKDTITYDIDAMSLPSLIKSTMSFFKEKETNDPISYAGEANFTDAPYKTMEALSRQHLVSTTRF